MRQISPITQRIISEIYSKVGGRPVDDQVKFVGPGQRPRERGPLTSIEAWWEVIEPQMDKMPKDALISIRRDLLNANMYGGFDEYLKKINKELGF